MTAERPFYIYCHTAPNGKRYIGQTCAERPERRWGKGYKGCVHLEHAIEKYGWDNFEHSVLAICCNRDMADRVETLLIKLYDTTNPEHGYNIQRGGHSRAGYTLSEETKRKISATLTGRPGRKLSPESKRKESESLKAAYREGRMAFSEEGCRRRDDVLRKNAAKKRRSVVQFSIDGQEIARYESISEACRTNGFCQSGIVLTCQGKHRQAHGFIWRYEDRPETFPTA